MHKHRLFEVELYSYTTARVPKYLKFQSEIGESKPMGRHLVIQIPAYNEEEHIGLTIKSLPKSIEGIDKITILVVSDGSTDGTVNVARSNGADKIVELPSNVGLARAFQVGLNTAVNLGADLVLNTDADGQYGGESVSIIVEEMLKGCSDVIIGDRGTKTLQDFGRIKRKLQVFGSMFTSKLISQDVPDATSGFRIYSAEVARVINVTNSYTYTLESLVQVSKSGYRISSIQIPTTQNNRPSKLVKNNFSYVRRNGLALLISYLQFAPWKLFRIPTFLLGSLGILFCAPFFLNYLQHSQDTRHLQLLLLGVTLILISILFLFLSLVSESIRAVRLNTHLILSRQTFNGFKSE